MNNYKKKLLDRYPELTSPVEPKPALEETASAESTVKPSPEPTLADKLEAALERDLAAAGPRRKKPHSFSMKWPKMDNAGSLLLFGVAAAAILGTLAGAAWTRHHFQATWNREIAQVQVQASYKLDRFFSSEDFSRMAAQKLAEHSEAETQRILSTAEGELKTVQESLTSETKAAAQSLQELLTLMETVARADNDDRKAFEELLKISRSREHPYRATANLAVQRIYFQVLRETYQDGNLPPEVMGPWSGIRTLSEYKRAYQREPALYRHVRLQALWQDELFPLSGKLDFLADVIREETSLRALAAAVSLMNRDAGLDNPFTAYEKYLDWWAAHRASYLAAGK